MINGHVHERVRAGVSRTIARTEPTGPEAIRMDSLEALEMEWLFENWIPLGMLTLFQGDPGLGKTTLVLDWVARATTARSHYPTRQLSTPVNALLFTAEDDIQRTILPRLIAAGADTSRVYLDDEDHPVETLLESMLRLEHYIIQTQARVIMFDPFSAYLGVDANSDAEVRKVLRPLSQVAQRHGVAIIGIRHLRKSADGGAMYRGNGSIGLTGAARCAHHVGRHPEEEDELVLACVKSNVGPHPRSLRLKLTPGDNGQRKVHWVGTCDLTADDLGQRPPGAKATKRNAASEWLLERLKDGPVSKGKLEVEGNLVGHSARTLQRARAELGLVVQANGRESEWALP